MKRHKWIYLISAVLLLLGIVIAIVPSLHGAHAAACPGSGCQDLSPLATICYRDAASVNVPMTGGFTEQVDLRYSRTCKTMWARVAIPIVAPKLNLKIIDVFLGSTGGQFPEALEYVGNPDTTPGAAPGIMFTNMYPLVNGFFPAGATGVHACATVKNITTGGLDTQCTPDEPRANLPKLAS